MFCLLCDSEEELYDGLCKSCYIENFQALQHPEYTTFTVCSHCGATLKHDKWVQKGYYDDEIINDAIQKDLEVNSKLEDVEITTQITNNRGTVYECIIHVYGSLLGEDIERQYPIEVKVEKGVCPDCSKFYSGYYEAVIQLRADGRKLDESEISDVDQFISDEIQRLCKTNKLAYITERIVLKEGIDYQVGSHNIAHKIVVNLQKHFGGVITQSRKIVGRDKSRSKDLYRSWISLRLASFHTEDFITYKDKVLKVESIGSHKFVAKNLETQKIEAIIWKEYDKVKKVATKIDIQTTTITNVTPREIQILDPDTYETLELEKTDEMNKLDIGGQVNIVKVNNKIYIDLEE